MVQGKSLTKSALAPLVLLWLAVHAVLLALILGVKFLTVKTVLLALLLIGSLAFLSARFRAKPRRLSHSP
jgi:hypothetical protein